MEKHVMTIRSSRLKYVNYYLSAFLVLLLLYFVGFRISLTRDVYSVGLLVIIILLLLPEVLRAKNFHKITNRAIISVNNFGNHTMSLLHNLVMDVHVIQNPFLKRFPNVGTVILKTFSNEVIHIKTVKNPQKIADSIQEFSLQATQNQPNSI